MSLNPSGIEVRETMRRVSPKSAWTITAAAVRASVGAQIGPEQRGVALLIVLVTTAVMGVLSTEFAYNTRTNIWMAGNVTAAGTGTWGDVAWIDYEALSTGVSQFSEGDDG